MSLKAIDLFCGAGGLTRGLVDAGFEITAAVDAWKPAVDSYRANFPTHKAIHENVLALTPKVLEHNGIKGTIDLIAGGPPCQGFSIQRIGDDQDHRNDLVLQFARIVRDVRPRMFLMENVPGLLGQRGRATFEAVLHMLSVAGYLIDYDVLDAAGYGVAQHRRRVFIVGQLNGVAQFPFPSPGKELLTVAGAIGDLPEPPDDFTPAPGDSLHRRIKLSPKNIERLKLIPPGGGFEDLPIEMRADCHKGGASKIGHRAVYGRLHVDRPAGTITGRFDSFTRGRFAHPTAHRNISLREGARLQGFPDSHQFVGTQEEIAAQIGNAIPPPLASAVAIAVRACIEGRRSEPSSVRSDRELTSAA